MKSDKSGIKLIHSVWRFPLRSAMNCDLGSCENPKQLKSLASLASRIPEKQSIGISNPYIKHFVLRQIGSGLYGSNWIKPLLFPRIQEQDNLCK